MVVAGPKVLVVEDDPSILNLLVSALARHGVAVDAARDGLAGLELIRETEYAVILLDLMMPRMNGFELIDAMGRVRPESRSVVIAMTAYDDGPVARLDPRRVHACFRKPFDVPRVVEMIRDCVRLQGGAVSEATEIEATAEEPRTEPPAR